MPRNPVTFVELDTLSGIDTTQSIQAQLDSKEGASLTNSHIFVGNASNIPTDVAMSGGATVDNTGFVTLGGALGYTTTATAAGTTVLTVTSTVYQFFTGSTTQTVTLPVVSTLTLGKTFTIVNNSSGTVTVNSSGGNLVKSVTTLTSATITCILTSGTGSASWSSTGPAGSGGASPTWADYTATITLVGGAGNTVPQYSTVSTRFATSGKIVFVKLLFTGDGGNEGAGSGQFNILLPTAAGANAGDAGDNNLAGYAFNGSTEYLMYGSIANSATTMTLSHVNPASLSAFQPFLGSEQNNTSRGISIRFFYEID